MGSMAGALNAWCCSARVRGDAHPDSDYDVAVFLRDLTDRWREIGHLAAIEANILAETGRYLDMARQSLAHARAILAIELGEEPPPTGSPDFLEFSAIAFLARAYSALL
jgi:hypothetical protein